MVTFDLSTKEARAAFWKVWNDAQPHQRSVLGPPPCYTCGAPPVGTYTDGSPRYGNCHGQKGADRD